MGGRQTISRPDLRRTLATLYPTPEQARLVARDAGIPLERIDVHGSPVVFWDAILDEASRHEGGEAALIAVSRADYPDHSFGPTGARPRGRATIVRDSLIEVQSRVGRGDSALLGGTLVTLVGVAVGAGLRYFGLSFASFAICVVLGFVLYALVAFGASRRQLKAAGISAGAGIAAGGGVVRAEAIPAAKGIGVKASATLLPKVFVWSALTGGSVAGFGAHALIDASRSHPDLQRAAPPSSEPVISSSENRTREEHRTVPMRFRAPQTGPADLVAPSAPRGRGAAETAAALASAESSPPRPVVISSSRSRGHHRRHPPPARPGAQSGGGASVPDLGDLGL